MDKIADLYFDIDGRPVNSAKFLMMFPKGRVRCARYSVFGLVVTTEFVGVNHNPDPNAAPWIFETLIVDPETGHIVLSRWTSTKADSQRYHVRACRFVRFGGAWLYYTVRFIRGI